MNNYWHESELDIQSLDFTLKNERLGKFDKCDVIDILNILRRLSEKLDDFMLKEIGEEKIVNRLVENFWEIYEKIKHKNTETIVSKFKHFAIHEFGIEYTSEQATQILGK